MDMTNSDSTAPRHEVDPHNFEAVFNATNPWKDSPSRAAPFNVIDSPRSAPVQPVAESLDVMMSRLATKEQLATGRRVDSSSSPCSSSGSCCPWTTRYQGPAAARAAAGPSTSILRFSRGSQHLMACSSARSHMPLRLLQLQPTQRSLTSLVRGSRPHSAFSSLCFQFSLKLSRLRRGIRLRTSVLYVISMVAA